MKMIKMITMITMIMAMMCLSLKTLLFLYSWFFVAIFISFDQFSSASSVVLFYFWIISPFFILSFFSFLFHSYLYFKNSFLFLFLSLFFYHHQLFFFLRSTKTPIHSTTHSFLLFEFLFVCLTFFLFNNIKKAFFKIEFLSLTFVLE